MGCLKVALPKVDIKDRWARPQVGGKGAHSGEILEALRLVDLPKSLQVVVPQGFAILKGEYEQWVAQGKPELPRGVLVKNLVIGYRDLVVAQIKGIRELMSKDERTKSQIKDKIDDVLGMVESIEHTDNEKIINSMIGLMRDSVKNYLGSDTAKDISLSLRNQLMILGVVVARSSGINEDGVAESGAGTKNTVLSIRSTQDLLKGVVDVWRSGAEAVLVEQMINAKSSVLVFSADAVHKRVDHLRIEAGFGLAKALVDRQIKDTDVYLVDEKGEFIERHIGDKEKQLILDLNVPEGMRWEDLGNKSKEQVLTDQQVQDLSHVARQLQVYFGFPIDMEASFDADDRLVILQVRPITTLTRSIKNGLALLQGDMAQTVEAPGGIDLTQGDRALEVKSHPERSEGSQGIDPSGKGPQDDKGSIKFNLDPAMIEQLRNATGFVPVIINIQPMGDLRKFLGADNSSASVAQIST